MKQIFIVLALFTLFGSPLNAQTADFEWVTQTGGNSFERAVGVATDDSGSVYVTGSYKETVDFDPGLGIFNLTSTNSIANDIFVQKLDGAGNFQWAISIGGTGTDDGNDLAVDASGNVYITGSFENTIDFDPGVATFNLTSSGSSDAFLLKLDADGNFIWVIALGFFGNEGGGDIAFDAASNVYLSGGFNQTVDFDPGSGTFDLTSAGGSDMFILKLDSSGSFIWARAMGGVDEEACYAIALDDSGNVYMTGAFKDTVDFDPGPAVVSIGTLATQDIYMIKLDVNGDFVWVKTIGNVLGAYTHAFDIASDVSGNIYIIGEYRWTVDFDPGLDSFNLSAIAAPDVFLLKLDGNGDFKWAISTGGSGFDSARGVTTDASGNVYVVGFYRGTVDFDPGPGIFEITANGNFHDIYILKLDSQGNFIWASSLSGIKIENGWAIALDAQGGVFITGDFQGLTDFDPGPGVSNLTPDGIADFYVLKLGQCAASFSTDVISACNAHTWIDGNTYTASDSTATYTINGGGANGCDSIVTLDLTIIAIDVTVTISDPSMTANETGASYQWLDCSNGFVVISGETAQNYTPTVNGDYAVEITINGCTDTSSCITITNVITALYENTLFNGVSVSPNPTRGIITVDLGQLKDVSIKVYDVGGKLTYHKEQVNTPSYQITLNGAPGIYMVEIIAQGQVRKYQIIKN